MKKLLFFIIAVILASPIEAQENNTPTIEEMKAYYKLASKEERARLDSAFAPMEDYQREQQVKTIGGVPFGVSREKALEMLRMKFGEPMYDPDRTTISFKNIKYAGRDFDNVHFLFQSDGITTYLNSCIFILSAKTQKDAAAQVEKVRSFLSDKYFLFDMKDEQTGFQIYSGGVSPMWDGHWYTLDDDMFGAIHTDVIEYNADLVEVYGNRYGVRLIYGPYNYVKEEF